jgi:hypothetical protein
MNNEFKAPDRSAPRYRPMSYKVMCHSLLKEFKVKYPGLKNITYDTFKNVIEEFNRQLSDAVITHRDGVELPENTGFIFIASTRLSKEKENIDFYKSIKYKKKVTHHNHETDGLIGKIIYTVSPVKYKIKDSNLWKLRASRRFKNNVTKHYPGNYNKYHFLGGVRPSFLFAKLKVS